MARRLVGARRAGLFFLAFASGFAVLTIEIAGARLMAPVYGMSAVPWTAVIGVILAALALGSHLGGRLADLGVVPLSWILVAAGFAGGIPVVGSTLPLLARDALGLVVGAVATAMVLFAPAVLCLGAVVPYLVQADTESLTNVGRRAGDMSAAATSGSIMGSFVTGFFLLPAMPLSVLLGVTAAALLGLALLSGWLLGRKPPPSATLVGVLVLVAAGVVMSRPGPGTLFQTQTLYASVRVVERENEEGRTVRELEQNGSSSSREWTDTWLPAHRYADASGVLLSPVIERVDSMLILGGAALSLPVALSKWRSGLTIDVVEIDPQVTRLAGEYFAYGRGSYPGIHVYHDDARVFLRRAQGRYDVVYLDVFDNLLAIPWTVVTTEAVEEMAGRLATGGLVMANIVSPGAGPGIGFLQRFLATLDQVFPAVRVYSAQPERQGHELQNFVVVAAMEPDHLPDTAWPEAEMGPAGRPLTDDWAPVEYLQAKLFVGFLTWY